MFVGVVSRPACACLLIGGMSECSLVLAVFFLWMFGGLFGWLAVGGGSGPDVSAFFFVFYGVWYEREAGSAPFLEIENNLTFPKKTCE